MIERILDFILGNIGIVVFIIFALTGVLRRGDKKPGSEPIPEAKAQPQLDHRPLAERLAEAFGVDLDEVTGKKAPTSSAPSPPAAPTTYSSDGRRGPTSRSVQDEYPDLFGGPGLFGDASGTRSERTRWGFDETEWGSTFEKAENQWGHTFPDKKSSEPIVEWPR